MTRRAIGLLVMLTFGFLVAPLAAAAPPQGRVYRLGIVSTANPVAQMMESGTDRNYQAFYGELRRLGYAEGQNLMVERWSAEGRPEHYPDIVAEAVRRTPDVILTVSSRLARLFQAATTTIPIVAFTADPIAGHLVTNLARPGGNLTGLSVDVGEGLLSKQLELLQEAVPGLARVALLGLSQPSGLRQLLEGAQQLGLTVQHVRMDGPYQEAQYVAAFQAMTAKQMHAMLVIDQPEHGVNRQRIVELAASHRLPGMYPSRQFVEVGGLMSYGANTQDLWRRMAGYVDRIFKGTKPGDLPFEQPTMFELVINLKTAQTLGLTIPTPLLFQATEVIR
jgi:putative ABC transport system substrate-binding protein